MYEWRIRVKIFGRITDHTKLSWKLDSPENQCINSVWNLETPSITIRTHVGDIVGSKTVKKSFVPIQMTFAQSTTLDDMCPRNRVRRHMYTPISTQVHTNRHTKHLCQETETFTLARPCSSVYRPTNKCNDARFFLIRFF